MAKVRITKSPGGVPDVKNHISAVPRQEANIEAEGGETLVGDVNGDGFLEHMSVQGNRHSQGGVPLSVPGGTFVFSDSKKSRIKDPGLLQHFTKNFKKAGYTPAQIAKQYDINAHLAILRDETADPIARRTAQYMVDSNLKKLSELSLVQEYLKGMPNGVPALGEVAAAGALGEVLLGNPSEQGQPMMREGGLVQFSGGGEIPKAGDTVYVGESKVKVKNVKKDLLFYDKGDVLPGFVELENGDKLTYQEWQQIRQGKQVNKGWGNYFITGSDRRTISQQQTRQVRSFGGSEKFADGEIMEMAGTRYKILNVQGERTRSYQESGKRLKDLFDDTEGIVRVRNLETDEIEFLEGEDISALYKRDKNLVKNLTRQQKQAKQVQAQQQVTGDNYRAYVPGAAIEPVSTTSTTTTTATTSSGGRRNPPPVDQAKIIGQDGKVLQEAPQAPAAPVSQQSSQVKPQTTSSKPAQSKYANSALYKKYTGQ